MRLRRRTSKGVPSLNTTSLPDLIFTVLFFFMIVTHMRQSEMHVKYTVPAGKEISKLTNKSAVTYVYVGKDINSKSKTKENDNYIVQVNGNVVPIEELSAYISAARDDIAEDDLEYYTISLKADKHTPLSIISKVKDALRDAEALTVSYSATKAEDKQ